MKFLIVGLGNPGIEYAETRHNIGFDVLNVLSAKFNCSFTSDRLADKAEIKIKGKPVILIKPSTYMNLSGRAVKYWLEKEKIPIENMLVIVDDLAFDTDTIKIKKSGSAGGHNGLKSIEECIATNQYARVRFGIGNHYAKGKQSDFVLGKWNDNEIPLINKKVEACCEIIQCFVAVGIDRTMNLFNNNKYNI